MSARLRSLSSNPTLRNFARDASQRAMRKVALFIAPLVPVPDVTGFYKEYNAKNRYKRPNTLRAPGQPVTQLGFSANDAQYNLRSYALDFPIPNVTGMSEETLMYNAQYGTGLLADASGLDHEAETISTALTAAGAGTDHNFASDAVDPIDLLDAAIEEVQLLSKNGAGIKVLFGARALRRTRANKNVRARIVSGARNGIVSPGLADIVAMLNVPVTADVAMYVQDTAAEGVAESIDYLLGNQILVFASNDEPNTMDPSFMKTLVPMSGWMKPGSYTTQDERDEVLKMDWTMQLITSNAAAIRRLNANNA